MTKYLLATFFTLAFLWLSVCIAGMAGAVTPTPSGKVLLFDGCTRYCLGKFCIHVCPPDGKDWTIVDVNGEPTACETDPEAQRVLKLINYLQRGCKHVD